MPEVGDMLGTGDVNEADTLSTMALKGDDMLAVWLLLTVMRAAPFTGLAFSSGVDDTGEVFVLQGLSRK